MKVSEFKKQIGKIQREHGDIEVYVDLKNVIDAGSHEEYTHENNIILGVKKIHIIKDFDKLTYFRGKKKILNISIE